MEVWWPHEPHDPAHAFSPFRDLDPCVAYLGRTDPPVPATADDTETMAS